MNALEVRVVAGGAAWDESAYFAAHTAWEAAWLAEPNGALRDGLRALTQWAAAAYLETLGRYAAATRVRDRARARLRRTEVRLALAPFALDLPSDDHDTLVLRDSRTPFAVPLVLLAAGHGRRAGGPKALIDLAGQPLWRRQVERLRANGLTRVIAVLHPAAALDQTPDLTTLHGDPDATPLHSLQRALTATSGPVLLLPIDCPVPSRAVTARLLAASLAEPSPAAVRPIVATPEGPLGGHPLWISAAVCAQVLRLDAAQHRLDVFLRSLGDAYVGVPLADETVLGNFNSDGVSR